MGGARDLPAPVLYEMFLELIFNAEKKKHGLQEEWSYWGGSWDAEGGSDLVWGLVVGHLFHKRKKPIFLVWDYSFAVVLTM